MQHNSIIINTAAFIAGIWCAGWYPWPPPFAYGVLLACCMLCLLQLTRESKRIMWTLAAVFFMAGVVRFIHADAISPYDISHYHDRFVIMHALVDEIPQITSDDGESVYIRYTVQAQEVETTGSTLPAAGKVMISMRQNRKAAPIKLGDTIKISGKVLALKGYQNPGAVDTVQIFKRQGITARMSVSAEQVKVISRALQPTWTQRFMLWCEQTRAQIRAAMDATMPFKDRAILMGLLFGGYADISPEVLQNFAATGIIHILSVSGSHIALISGVIFWGCGLIKLNRWGKVVITAAIVLSYALLAGGSAPVLRSVIMGLIALLAVALERDKDAASALACAALLLLCYQPALIYDLSFQLSFLSTAGLIYLYQPLCLKLKVLPRRIAEPAALTLAAQLAVLPFIAYYFSSFSLSSLIANLVIVPLLDVVVVLGLTAIVVVMMLPVIGKLMFIICSLIIGAAIQLTAMLAAIPGGVLRIPAMGVASGIIYYLVLALSAGYAPRQVPTLSTIIKTWPRQASLCFGIIIIGVLLYSWYPRPLYVHFIDVGQGDAALIITPHGKAILVDTGGATGNSAFDVGERVVVPYLKHFGVAAIEYMILTHGHQDHAGGARAVAAALPVKNILVAREQPSPAVQALLAECKQQGVIPAYAGQTIVLDNVRLQVLHAAAGAGSNEVSSVIRLDYGQHSFLFTGDLEAAGEKALLKGRLAPVNVLKVGHHGARTSTTAEFLQALRPEFAVISVGRDNRFGHPHQEVLARLRAGNVKILRTDQQGAITFITDGSSLSVETFVKAGGTL